MLMKLRRDKRAQSLVIVALSATALFGIIALGLDASRLYFQRRDVQNAADAGALAGAQELIPNTPDPNGDGPKARCMSATYALKLFNLVPAHDCSSSNLNGFWSSANTVTDNASGSPTPR